MPLEVNLTNEEAVDAVLAPTSSTGKPVKVDGPPVWSIISGDGTVVPSADGLSAAINSGDALGDTIVGVEADADLGAGVETIADTITLHVGGAKAKNLGLSVSSPRPKT